MGRCGARRLRTAVRGLSSFVHLPGAVTEPRTSRPRRSRPRPNIVRTSWRP